MTRDARIDAYIAAQAAFARPILEWWRAHVQALCPEAVETIKWGRPFFLYRGKPVALAAAFKGHASLGVWRRDQNASGREGVGFGQFGRLTALSDVPVAEFDAMLRAEMALIEADAPARRRGVPKPEMEVPAALAAALADDAAAQASFAGFPPSARRDYCEWIAEAKRPETRARRVADAVAWLREGKRRTWKHEAR